jgi:hypothetical protein
MKSVFITKKSFKFIKKKNFVPGVPIHVMVFSAAGLIVEIPKSAICNFFKKYF